MIINEERNMGPISGTKIRQSYKILFISLLQELPHGSVFYLNFQLRSKMVSRYSPPPVTVVIPVYNRANIVRRTLMSLDSQTCRNFGTVLVDNASTDGTRAVLEGWSRRTSLPVKIIDESRRGAAAARQTGLQVCDSDWVMFFDSDDIMLPGHIERAIGETRMHPDADLIGWDIWHNDGSSRVRKPFVTADIKYRSLFNGTLSTQRYFARRKLFEAAGGWDPDMGLWDDIELGARLLLQKPVIRKSEGEPTVEVFVQPDSITGASVDTDAVGRALRSIALSYGNNSWTALKEMILAANTPGTHGDEIRRKVLASAETHRFLLRMAYIYTRLGGRGIARILRPFM